MSKSGEAFRRRLEAGMSPEAEEIIQAYRDSWTGSPPMGLVDVDVMLKDFALWSLTRQPQPVGEHPLLQATKVTITDTSRNDGKPVSVSVDFPDALSDAQQRIVKFEELVEAQDAYIGLYKTGDMHSRRAEQVVERLLAARRPS